MKQLLIEEMKRAISIMESKEEIKKVKMVPYGDREYPEVDRETSELKNILKAIRRHSVLLEKEIK